MIKYIQNLDSILANLEKTGIIIAGSKSEFCYFRIKIVGYIYNSESWHPDRFKVLKIFDQSEFVNVIITQAFMNICMYYQI